MVHLDCNEPKAQYDGCAAHTEGRNWSFDYIEWSKFSRMYVNMQLWRLQNGPRNTLQQE